MSEPCKYGNLDCRLIPDKPSFCLRHVHGGGVGCHLLEVEGHPHDEPCPACSYLAVAPRHAPDCAANPRLIVAENIILPPLTLQIEDDEPEARAGGQEL